MWSRLGPALVGVLFGGLGLLGYRSAESHPWVQLPPEQVLAERFDPYLEPEDGRCIAEVDARLVRQEVGAALFLHVDAVGPDVDPVPGLEGVAGINAMTAREVDALLREEDGLKAQVVLASGKRVEGGIVPGYPVRLTARRLGEDGRIEYHDRTPPLVAAFTVIVSDLPVGEHRFELFARGEVRLRGTFTVGADGGSFGGFAATGGLHRRRAAQ